MGKKNFKIGEIRTSLNFLKSVSAAVEHGVIESDNVGFEVCLIIIIFAKFSSIFFL